MPKPSNPSLSLKPRGLRQSAPVPEDVARRLEAAAEAQGNGVAGARDLPPPAAVEAVTATMTKPIAVAAPAASRPNAKAQTPTTPLDGSSHGAGSHGASGAGTLKVPRERKDGVQTRSTSIHLPVDLGRRIKMYCAQNDLRQNEVILEAIEEFLRARG